MAATLLFLAWRRRWKSIMGLLAALVLVIVFCGVWMLLSEGILQEAEQSYSWDGWYWIGPFVLLPPSPGSALGVLALWLVAWGFVDLFYRGARLVSRGARRVLSRPPRPRTTAS
jgi:hypothetical protein